MSQQSPFGPPPMRRDTIVRYYKNVPAFHQDARVMQAAGWHVLSAGPSGKRHAATWVRDVPANVPPNAQLPKQARSGLRPLAIVGIAIGGLFALLIVIGSIGSAGGGTATATPAPIAAAANDASPPPAGTAAPTSAGATPTTPPNTATPRPPTNTPGPTNTPAPKAGQDVRVPLAKSNQGTQEGQRVTILGIADDAKSDNQFEHPSAGNKYIAMTVLIENVGSKETLPGTWKLRSDTDFEYGDSIAVGFGPSLPYTTLTSGGKTQGVVVFEVPQTAKMKWLKYDPNQFSNGDLYFDP